MIFLIQEAVALSPEAMTFSLRDLLEIAALAFALGVLWTQVRNNSKAILRIEEKHEAAIAHIDRRMEMFEEKFLSAVRVVGSELSELARELKSLFGGHETRITVLEKETEKMDK